MGGGGSGAGGGAGGEGATLGAQLDCPAGELRVGDQCVPPGVPADGCGHGFSSDGEGGCVAILPAEPCADGRMALPGETTCRPVAECGSGSWGDIPTDGSTVFVDASYGGPSPNGSQGAPYPSLQTAIDAAPAGALVAVAAGSYGEDLDLEKPLTIWGKCPDEVVVGASGGAAAVDLSAAASGTVLRSLSLTGAGAGVVLSGASGVTIEQIRIFDTSGAGIYAYRTGSPAELSVQGCLLERTSSTGLRFEGATATIEDTVVRDTQPNVAGDYGRGLDAISDASSSTPASIVVRRSIVEQSREQGLVVFGSDLTVEDCLVRDTLPQASDQRLGVGIHALRHDAPGLRSQLTVTRTVVERSHYCGVCATDSELTMSATTVRDVQPEQSSAEYGFGARVYGQDPSVGQQPAGTIQGSLLEHTHLIGLAIASGEVTVETTLIRDTQPRASDLMFGRGISVEIGDETELSSTMIARGLHVEASHEVGIHVLASIGHLEAVHVLDTQPRAADQTFGAGLAFTRHLYYDQPTSGSARQVVIDNCIGGGLAVAAADVVVEDLVVRDTQPQVGTNDFGDGVVVSSYLVFTPDLYPSTLELTRATVTGNARAGIANFGATISLGEGHMQCNGIDLDGERAAGLDFTFEDWGDNFCGCEAEPGECQVMSSGLSPPMPVM